MSTTAEWGAVPTDGRSLLSGKPADGGQFDDVLFGSSARSISDAAADPQQAARRRRVVAIVIVSVCVVALVVTMGALGISFLSGLSDALQAH